MATIDDLPRVEGIRDFYRGEIYGEISDLLIDKGYFFNKNHPLFLESLSIMDLADSLVDVVLNDSIAPEKKDEIIEAAVQSLSQRTAALRATLTEPPEQEASNTDCQPQEGNR